jgi:acylphosphatase
MAVYLRISGRVQGVGYRAWAVHQARALRLAGWVRNRRDGTVEIAVAGKTEALGRFLALCRRGSPAAEVSGLTQSEQPDDALPDPFEARYTA